LGYVFVKNHFATGSLLLGALIIAIIKIIQFIVWYFEKQIKKASKGNMTIEWQVTSLFCVAAFPRARARSPLVRASSYICVFAE
jgi:hypothetical protein